MGDYYNSTRGSVSVTLRNGGAISIGPKTWCYLAPEDEGAADLATALRKGFLRRALVPITVAPQTAQAPLAVEAATVAPVVTTEPSVTAAEVFSVSPVSDVVEGSEPSTTVQPKQYRKNKSF
jgi:hypothetical protein